MENFSEHKPIPSGDLPTGWLDALYLLIASRIELIQVELKDVARKQSSTLAALILALACICFAWALILAGGLALIASLTSTPWPVITLIAAGAHLLIALLLVLSCRKPKPASFPITRAEFQKDREWIASLQNKPTSKR